MKRREEPIPALSAGLSYVTLTGVLLLAALPALPPGRSAGFAVPAPSAIRAPAPASPSAATSTDIQPVKEEWPQEDIARGREQCMHLLSSMAADVEWLEPVKKGECGLPAPVRLKSVGSDESKVVFDPPVDVNCRMVVALGKWVKSTLQPKAQDRFKSPVARILRASGYSCRNIYNLPNARLSQHALANAIDIGGFALANGRTINVLKGWGLTARDVKAMKAKAEADAKAKAARAKTAAAKEDKTASDPARVAKPEKTVKQASATPTALSLDKKPAATAALETKTVEPPKPTAENLFLRAIHSGACREFGTVLGPEANDPHRNHFHLDLIPRRSSGFCE